MATFAGLASAAVLPRAYEVPQSNGFPNPSPNQTLIIETQAGGLLPNAPLPTTLGANSITAFQLIASNELFETAYFSSLLKNITDCASGYEASNKHELVKVFQTVLAQEELHAIGARAILESAGAFVPGPCQYQFPVSTLQESITVAETFTVAVLGALQGANVIFAEDGEPGLVQLVSSIIGQEGEQNGYYRVLLEQVPSESPFLTPVPATFAWSVLQNFIVPGSCPFALDQINIPILPTISVNGGPIGNLEPEDQTLTLSVDLSTSPNAAPYIGGDGAGLTFTYTTGKQLPITVSISDVNFSGSVISFKAPFPYSEHIMQGFSHGALTTGSGYENVTATAAAAIAGPALIQVRNPLKW